MTPGRKSTVNSLEEVHRHSSDYKLENILNRSFAIVRSRDQFPKNSKTIRFGVMILAGAERAD